ncbi:MAG TPA: PAS domain S-box protein, partial [Candidatus Kapabacteria bacterium]|nr:PAS domain S-box protein [Candidatus Kapabacteria bacterium]
MDNYDKDYIDASKNILVVEDNEGLQKLIVKTLNKNGFNAIGVSTGKEAIEKIRTSSNIVLLLDQNLPDMTGYDIILHLNSLSIKVPFIVMTGHGDERLAVEMMKLGAYDYLVKDINFTDILPSVLERVYKNILIEKRLHLAEKSLKDSEAKLRSLFEAMQDVIIVLDSNGNYVETAPTSSEILKEKPITLQGKSLFDVFPEKLANEGLQLITNVLKLNSNDYIDYEIKLAGKSYWYSATISPYTENTVLWVARDITERKEAELALIEKEKRFRLLVQNSNDIIIIVDKEGYPIYVSDQIKRILGYEQEDFIGKNCFLGIHPDDIQEIKKIFTESLEKPGKVAKGEYRFKHKNGSWIYLETVGSNLLYDASVNGIVLNTRDITERKKSEAAILESEEKWRSYIKAAPYSISIVDENLKFIEVNPATCIITGLSEEELKLIGVPDLLAPESVIPVMKSFKNQILNTGKFYGEGYFTNKSGEKRFWSVASQTISENRFLSFCEDITDRKIAEQALIDSEERFRSIFENATIGIYRTTPDGKILLANPMLIKLLGYNSLGELSKIDVKEKGYADPNKREEFLSIMKERGEAKGFESVWLRNDGSKVYIRESAKTFYNEDGSVKYYEGTVEDITEQELAKEALLESEELFSKLIQTVPDLIIRTDIEGNITFVNEAVLLSHLNVKKENVIGKNIMSFISERDLP